MKKKGNISLLVLFVLVACSLLGIIAVQYIKHMAIQTNQMYSFYKTYYLAKWWSEIWLSLMKLRWVWYSMEIQKEDPFVLQNISTGNFFSLKIQWDNWFISNWYPEDKTCNNPIKIPGKEWYILQLFTDSPWDNLMQHFSKDYFYKNKSDLLKTLTITWLDVPRDVGVGIILSSWWTLLELWIYFTNSTFEWEDFFENISDKIQETFNTTNQNLVMNRQREQWLQNYLIIANKNSQELSFCLELPTGDTLTLPKTYISSFGYVWDKKTGLETIYQQPIPSYLIDSSIFE